MGLTTQTHTAVYSRADDAVAIHFREGVVPVKTDALDERRFIDYDQYGDPIGVEILDVSMPFSLDGFPELETVSAGLNELAEAHNLRRTWEMPARGLRVEWALLVEDSDHEAHGFAADLTRPGVVMIFAKDYPIVRMPLLFAIRLVGRPSEHAEPHELAARVSGPGTVPKVHREPLSPIRFPPTRFDLPPDWEEGRVLTSEVVIHKVPRARSVYTFEFWVDDGPSKEVRISVEEP